MKRQNKHILCIMSMVMMSSSLLHAAQPKFSIIPVNGSITSILLPSNFTETVQYQVTNQTKLAITMVPIAGVSQTTAGVGVCPNPFTLAMQENCTLTWLLMAAKFRHRYYCICSKNKRTK